MTEIQTIEQIHRFEWPDKIVVGIDSVETVGSEAKKLGMSKVLLVTDKGVLKAGQASKVKDLLEKDGIEVEICDKVSGEPTLEIMNEISEITREGEYNGIVGVGGGSSLDSAKVAAVAATNPGDVKHFIGVNTVKRRGLPKILIPTTAGTGSEATQYAVIIDGEIKLLVVDSNLFPEVAIVDPKLTMDLPPRITASSGLDALSHAVEAFLSKHATPLSDAFALKSIELVSNSLREAYFVGRNLKARYDMAFAAMLGGLSIASPAEVIVGHKIAQAFSPKYNVPHGISCAIVLPYIMEYSIPAQERKLATIASHMGVDVGKLSLRESAYRAVEEVKRLMKDLKVPISLREIGFPREDLYSLAESILSENLEHLQEVNPWRIDRENLKELLKYMWEGKR